MATIYIASDTISDLAAAGADFDYSLLPDLGTQSDIVVNFAKGATETSYLFTEAGVPGTSGTSTGTFTMELNIVSGDTNMYLAPTLSRVNSGGSPQSTSAAAANTQLTAGVKTWTWTNPALGTWAAGDRLRVDLPFKNIAAHATASITIGFNTADDEFTAPWTILGKIPYSFDVII